MSKQNTNRMFAFSCGAALLLALYGASLWGGNQISHTTFSHTTSAKLCEEASFKNDRACAHTHGVQKPQFVATNKVATN